MERLGTIPFKTSYTHNISYEAHLHYILKGERINYLRWIQFPGDVLNLWSLRHNAIFHLFFCYIYDMYMYGCIYIYIYMIYKFLFILSICYICGWTYTWTYEHRHIQIYVYIICAYIYIYTFTYVYMYIYRRIPRVL